MKKVKIKFTDFEYNLLINGMNEYNGPHVKTNPEKIIVNQIIPY